MIYTPLTKKAMEIAYQAHHGQRDAGGTPYIFHVTHVAEQMEDEVTTCAALLHDVVEDTEITLQQLQQEFPREVTELVSLLTRAPKEDYFVYIERICGNEAAKRIKLADLAHNSDRSRLADTALVSEEKQEIWRVRYEKARKRLLEETEKF
ncbi:MAG: bifunctional (p)ppGpp synthetase/guanosine-3',5'-bis(diphosphate) 3'-pyrophosphohydrolase [Lachnospiraceae bacterium]|nr:bifunctional (p)ppGpp synthetase/guanosine-3',5'-bis(diphosphate) 3'-pyrophosphohydrolase [Lachnospiraceae bacterium]